jgi:hypothetical protein
MTLIACLSFVFAGCASSGGSGSAAPAAGVAQPGQPAKAEPGYKYVCGCGSSCDCGTSADKPGACGCGKPMIYKKILHVYPNTFGVCPDPACTLNEVDPANPNKCLCGKDLMIFPKQGRYSCACPSCDCGTTSRGPGKCACGVEMKVK